MNFPPSSTTPLPLLMHPSLFFTFLSQGFVAFPCLAHAFNFLLWSPQPVPTLSPAYMYVHNIVNSIFMKEKTLN